MLQFHFLVSLTPFLFCFENYFFFNSYFTSDKFDTSIIIFSFSFDTKLSKSCYQLLFSVFRRRLFYL